MPRIDLSRQAEKFLKSLPAKHALQIAEHLLSLQIEPDVADSIEMKGYTPVRRMKSGEYRIIHRQDGDTVFITLIGKRSDDDIYKQLQRLLK